MHVYYRVGEELAFNASGVPSVGYSESALRCGLLDIQPIEIVKTIKKFGLKFKEITRTFQTLKPPESFADLVTFENETIFNSIDIPEWFDANRLVGTFSQHSIKQYEQDTELKNEIERIRKSERIGRPLLSFTQFIRQRFESKRDHYLEIEAHRFLNSNLPLSFYNKLVVFDNTYYDLLKIVEKIVRMYEFRASVSRNFNMYKKIIGEMKMGLGPIIDKFDECSLSHSRLKKYLSVWNSKDYEEVFYPDFIDVHNVDFSKFEELSDDYNTRLREMRGLLLHHNPEFLDKKLDPKDPTTRMFGKLVMLPQSSYSL